jgi:hypothetical protein
MKTDSVTDPDCFAIKRIRNNIRPLLRTWRRIRVKLSGSVLVEHRSQSVNCSSPKRHAPQFEDSAHGCVIKSTSRDPSSLTPDGLSLRRSQLRELIATLARRPSAPPKSRAAQERRKSDPCSRRFFKPSIRGLSND